MRRRRFLYSNFQHSGRTRARDEPELLQDWRGARGKGTNWEYIEILNPSITSWLDVGAVRSTAQHSVTAVSRKH